MGGLLPPGASSVLRLLSPFQPHLALEMGLDTSQIKVRGQSSAHLYFCLQSLRSSFSQPPCLFWPSWQGFLGQIPRLESGRRCGCCQGNRGKEGLSTSCT